MKLSEIKNTNKSMDGKYTKQSKYRKGAEET